MTSTKTRSPKATIVYVESKQEVGLFLYYGESRNEADAWSQAVALSARGTRSLTASEYAPSLRLPLTR